MNVMKRYEQNARAYDLERAIFAMVNRIGQAERKLATCKADDMDQWFRVFDHRHAALRRLVVALRRMPGVN